MKKVIIIFFVLFLFSCIEELEIKLPEPEPQLVVNSLLNPDSLYNINISKTTSIFDSVPEYMPDAEVKLYENNVFLETLTCSNDGFFISETLKPDENKIYTVEIKTEEFGFTCATDTIPRKGILISCSSSDVIGSNTYGNYYADLTVNFNDDPEVDNYYEVFLFTEYIREFPEEQDTTFSNTFWFSNELSVTEENENADNQSGNYNSILFKDKYFNGENVNLHINYFLPYNYVNEDGHIIPENYKLLIAFHTVSKQYYDFMQKLRLYEYSQSEFWNVGEAVHLKGNIQNGLGIFAGYTTDIDTLTWDY